jgi:hypothetical protein
VIETIFDPESYSVGQIERAKQVSTRGKVCSVCGHYMLVAPYRDDRVTTVHLPNGRHTYRIRKGWR